MSIFDILTMIGGLCLFLFGMNIMGTSLEKRAGGSLKALLGKLTTGKIAGLLTGLGVTAVIQSSSATTVMLVGFVNSGIMTLRQAINVIMGANIGTTVTSWILSLAGINSDNPFVCMLKPSAFTPILALIGIIMLMSTKAGKRRDTAMILLGLATLLFGMETMSDAVAGLKDVPEFTSVLTMFSSPFLGVIVGALFTAVIQSSSASVGVLQALSATGGITIGTSVPIIMGQNIGTCITAMVSSVGANKNARRAATVHLLFNIIGTAVWLCVFCVIKAFIPLDIINRTANAASIAVVHTVFNLLCTMLMFPLSGLLEKAVCRIIPDGKQADETVSLDERLMATPPVALERCRVVTNQMADISAAAVKTAVSALFEYGESKIESVHKNEDEADKYEDILGTYLVNLSAFSMSAQDRTETAKLLHVIGDFERISDHAVNIAESATEMHEKGTRLSDDAVAELKTITEAVNDILGLTVNAFANNDSAAAMRVEPLEQVVDKLKDQLRTRHIERMQSGDCSIEAGFIWSDLLTNLERIADHCSNIAGCIIELAHSALDLHEYLHTVKEGDPEFIAMYNEFAQKYAVEE